MVEELRDQGVGRGSLFPSGRRRRRTRRRGLTPALEDLADDLELFGRHPVDQRLDLAEILRVAHIIGPLALESALLDAVLARLVLAQHAEQAESAAEREMHR